MPRYFWLRDDTVATSRYSGDFDAAHKWGLLGARTELRFRQKTPPDILDEASLPTDTDLFRVGNFATVIIGTDRFKDAVEQGGWTGISFRELPVRS
ncbi:hypothetical protein D7V97_31890 [Corallococcus sp. CA053C]|uniref:double-CXXCG motif protein n=1 Tax=Corallococcus sp. CA053C TaxID=2316732 RepID=UPI000EA13D10|nr:double-CXXCG motif protein [Corallococcus sp. CA053C]RKG99283.1 hypothetical protein D7V97_31890 [Corallococcus sp. CA053C]